MEGNKVSIVMPVYNAQLFLDESIADILNQTEKEFELICVDDGSVDNSLEIIKKYCLMDERVKFIHQENAGGGAARNAGLKLAKGKYVLFLDSDDRFERDLLESVFEKAEELLTDVLVFGGDIIDFKSGEHREHAELLNISVLSEKSIEECMLKESDKSERLFSFTNTTIWNKLLRREFVEENNLLFQETYVANALYFTMMALFEAKRIGFLNRKFVHYRCGNPKGLLTNPDKDPMAAYDALRLVKSKLVSNSVFEKYRKEFVVYAADMIMRRFVRLKQFGNIKNIHNMLHEQGLCELDIFSEELKGTKSQRWIKRIVEIEKYPFDECLYNRELASKRKQNGSDTFKLPKLPVAKSSAIAIYGAGNVGKSYFMQLFDNTDYRLKAWVDKRWEKIGFPLQNVDVLKDSEIDKVIIAVADGNVAEEIIEELVKNGVPKEKLYWDCPRNS